MMFSWGSGDDDAADYEELITGVPRPRELVRKASIYALIHGSATGDVVVLYPNEPSDKLLYVGVVINRSRGLFGQGAYILTENGLYDALPFAVAVSRYYMVVFLSRRPRADCIFREYLKRRVKLTPLPDPNVPLDFCIRRHKAFKATVLKVLLDGKLPTADSLLDDLEALYEDPRQALCMHQE